MIMQRIEKRSKDHHVQGFTLAEVIIAITIFAVVISMTYGAYSITFKVMNSARDKTRFGERARVTLDRFVEDIESFHKGKTGFLKGASENFGDKRGDTINFTSSAHLVLDIHAVKAGYSIITYSVEEDEETGLLKLYRSDIAYKPGLTGLDEKGFLLCEELSEVKITYFNDDGDEEERWDSTLGGREKYPSAVQLTIGFGTGGEDDEDALVYYTASATVPPLL